MIGDEVALDGRSRRSKATPANMKVPPGVLVSLKACASEPRYVQYD